MDKILNLFKDILRKAKDNDLMSMANALTYKLLLAIFPFLIFLMTLIAFINIDTNDFMNNISMHFPDRVVSIIDVFIKEVVSTKRISLLSSSLLLSLYSASSGFDSFILGLNKAYEIDCNGRCLVKRKIISLFLVVIFTALIISTLYIMIFSSIIREMLIDHGIIAYLPNLFDSLYTYVISIIMMIVIIIIIYRIAISKPVPIRLLCPGAIFTILGWYLLSKGYNAYINNFSKYSVIYGSIGSIFIFVIWLNLVSYLLLIGGQINAVLYKNYRLKIK